MKNNKNTYKLDQKFVDQLPLVESGSSKIYFDQSLKGFGVSVGKTVKSYIIQREVNRKSVRTTIGRSVELSVARAREEARLMLHDMRNGTNHNAERKALVETERLQNAITLRSLLSQHTHALAIKGHEYASKAYPKTLAMHVTDWLGKPITSITRDKVIMTHRKIGQHSPAMANKVFRIIRALINQYRIDTPDFANPVEILSLKKLWFEEKSRDVRIKPHEMQPWLESLTAIVENQIHRDYMLFLLLNGLRRNEGLLLKWENVDFTGKTFTIVETKNKKPLELPMSDLTEELLVRLHQLRDLSNPKTSQWVFPSERSTPGRLREPKKSLAAINEQLNMDIHLHDLRRTFVSVANSINISPYTIKRLVNHSVGNDVTAAVYNVMDVDDLRQPMQQIADQFKQWMEIDSNDDLKVIPMVAAR